MTPNTITFVNRNINPKKVKKAAKDPKSRLWSHIVISVRNSFVEVPDKKLQDHLDRIVEKFDKYCEKATEDTLKADLLLEEQIVFQKIFG